MADKKINFRLSDGTEVTLNQEIVDNLTSTDTNKALSANQGKVLDEKVGYGGIQLLNGTNLDDVKKPGVYSLSPARTGCVITVNTGFRYGEYDTTDVSIISGILIVDSVYNYNNNTECISQVLITGPSSASTLMELNDGQAVIFTRLIGSGSGNWSPISSYVDLVKCGTIHPLTIYMNEDGEIATYKYYGLPNVDSQTITELYIPDKVTVENSLASTSTTSALSAAQGKALNEAKAPRPIFSTTDIEIGSDLECGQLYFVMN